MKLVTERTVVGSDGDAGGEVVLVGVKFDGDSKELLTWALMKMAKPGDRVIALHVLDSIDEFVGGTSSLLSLVKTFDSLLTVYEGFCNLKQVDLKLKVCRGSSARKVLVREAKSSCAGKIIVGTSKTHHKIRSSTSVAKYCASHLSKNISVFSVSNGKITFQRESSLHRLQDKLTQKNQNCMLLSPNAIAKNSPLQLMLPDNSATWLRDEPHEGSDVDNSFALVSVQSSGSESNSAVVEKLPEGKRGWSVLRLTFLHKQRITQKSHVKRNSVVKLVSKLPGWKYSSVVYPDKKQNIVHTKEVHCSNLDEYSGVIVPVTGCKVAWSPISPQHGSDNLPEALKELEEKYSSLCRLFSYEELCFATCNFMPENLVGKGGSSHVYKGCLPDGKELAVKILKQSENVLKEFVAEIEIITSLHHKNIMSLFGFCFEQSNLFLVYDFLPRGSLEENLHGNKKDGNSFGWQERYKAAVGVAEALFYLHNLCDRPVIHRDVKSSNILLSEDFEPQLSDFGLASWMLTTPSHLDCIDVAGTFGYLAPEYFMHGKVSEKVDVFAFGVVLLELLSGKMPINGENSKGQESLVMWAKPILEGGKVYQLLDPHIGKEYDDGQFERMVLAATLCIRRSPRFRPQISIILKLLQGDKEVTNWARQEVGTLEVDDVDGEVFATNIQAHLNIALLDLEDDSFSISSTEQGVSSEDYLRGRWSRTSSFDEPC